MYLTTQKTSSFKKASSVTVHFWQLLLSCIYSSLSNLPHFYRLGFLNSLYTHNPQNQTFLEDFE